MKLPSFKLEDFFAKYEFVAKYSLGSSDPETFSLQELLAMADQETQMLWDNLRLGYTETHGLPSLRDEIAKLYQKQSAEQVLVFSGAEEAIFVSAQLLIEPGDEVIVLTPCYQSLMEIPRALSAKVKPLPLKWQNKNWQFDMDLFTSLLSKQTKLVILNFPHNPTGFVPSVTEFKIMIDLISQHNAYLFSDEVYRLSEYSMSDCLPAAVDIYPKAISLGVMSKTFGLPGLRIGWLALNDRELLAKMAAYKNYTSICNSAPSEILALIGLRNQQLIARRNVDIAQKNLTLLAKFFDNYQQLFDWYQPKAGFINFPRFLGKQELSTVATALIEQAGVIIIPGELFDCPRHFRLGFGRANLAEALIQFEKFVERALI